MLTTNNCRGPQRTKNKMEKEKQLQYLEVRIKQEIQKNSCNMDSKLDNEGENMKK